MCATQSNLFSRVYKPLSLPKERRLLRSTEFREAYQSGIRLSCRYFAAFCLHRAGVSPELSRIGFTLPRAIGKAVIRNRIRRRMREAAQLQLSRLSVNWIIVFNPRRTALDAPFEDLCRETGRIMERCNQRS